MCPCCCCYFKAAVRCLHWAALYSQSIAIEERPMGRLQWSAFSSQRGCVWQFTRFGGRKWRSGMNRISHPDWLKLSVELNCAPNQNTKFFSSLQLNHKNGNCPARGSTCSACGRKNHWARMCHNKNLKKTKKRTGSHRRTGLPNQKNSHQCSMHIKTSRTLLKFRTR